MRLYSGRHGQVPVAAAGFSALLCIALASCGGNPSEAGKASSQGGDRPIAVTTLRVKAERFADTYIAPGTVKARESVTITAKVSELVQQVHFDSGDTVRAGTPLITLSDGQQQAALVEAQANASDADQQYRRLNELAEQKLIARAQLDNQRTARDAAQARVAQIRAQLADRVIRAPFAGVLGMRQVSPGALIAPGTAIATLDALDRVYVDFPLPEAQLARAVIGARTTGTVAAWSQVRFVGVIASIDARIDPTTRSVLVRAAFDNADRQLRPGMLMTVALSSAERQAFRVPEIAVIQIGHDSFLYRVKADDRVEQIKVTLASRDSGKVEIIEGVQSGDRIVVEGAGKLRPKAKISETQDNKSDSKSDSKSGASIAPMVQNAAAISTAVISTVHASVNAGR